MPSSVDLAERLASIVKLQEEIAAKRLDLADVRVLVVERVQELTGADGAAFELILPEQDEVVYKTTAGSLAPHAGTVFDLEGSLSGLAIINRETMHCDDVRMDSRVNREMADLMGIRSMVVVPLLHEGKPVGVLKVVSGQPGFFSDLDVYSLKMLGGFIAGAIDHAATWDARVASEARFRLLFDRSLAGAFRSTLDGRVLDANESIAELLGFTSREDLMQEKSWNLYPQRADRENLLEILKEKKSITHHRLCLKRRDGTIVETVVNMDLIPDERETYILGTIIEIKP